MCFRTAFGLVFRVIWYNFLVFLMFHWLVLLSLSKLAQLIKIICGINLIGVMSLGCEGLGLFWRRVDVLVRIIVEWLRKVNRALTRDHLVINIAHGIIFVHFEAQCLIGHVAVIENCNLTRTAFINLLVFFCISWIILF